MKPHNAPNGLKDGAPCAVKAGTHAGKHGLVRNINTSKTGAVTITVEQDDGVRFKTLAKNVELKTKTK
jgi:ribosomal protein S4E